MKTEMASTPGFYDKNELHGSPVAKGDWMPNYNYRQVSNIRRTLVGNWIVDHSHAVGASSVGAAPTTSSFFT